VGAEGGEAGDELGGAGVGVQEEAAGGQAPLFYLTKYALP
jgi:hypothetical protein